MAHSKAIRVLIVDDHSLLRLGLQQALEQTGEFEVVGQAADGEEAVRRAGELKPDIVVMDVLLPRKNGVEACREIMEALPETRVIMLTAVPGEDAVVEAVAAGAIGYLSKETGLERLLSVVRGVARGELHVPADVVRRVFAGLHNTDRGDAAQQAGLTNREREILIAFALGTSYSAIAEQRGVKSVTIRNAVYRIQQKLDVRSIQEMVLWAARNGLTEV